MADVIVSRMDDARDAEDRRLLDEGAHAHLVECYYGVIVDRCAARLPADDALDVAADVVVRLLSELARGRRYAVPFRVVVHNVVGWKIKEHWARRRGEPLELPDDLAADDPFEEVEAVVAFEQFLEGTTPLEREVLTLRWRDGVELEEIASRLGKSRNAVDQIVHRGVARLRRRLAA